DPSMHEADANVAALASLLPAPLVADLPWQAGAAAAIDPRALTALRLDMQTSTPQ
ncbi:MAG: hypothetical protein GZ089_08635, partial [Aromatoleum sp.]|nr:hypothetical protein [Aromatoleum sp.]